MFQGLKCQVSNWFFNLINIYLFESKLFHFLSGTICRWNFIQCNRFTPLVYKGSHWDNWIEPIEWVSIISKTSLIAGWIKNWSIDGEYRIYLTQNLVYQLLSQPRQINYIFTTNRPILHIQSNLPMRLPLLSSHLYLKVTCFLTCHRKLHMKWTSFKRSPVL